MSQARTYPLSDPAAMAAKVKAAGGPAIDPTQQTGKVSVDGVTIGWSVARGQILTTIISKPWIVTYETIWSYMDPVFG